MVQAVMSGGSLVFQIDPPPKAGAPPPPPKLVATCPVDKLYCGYYLVVCDSEILLVGHTDSSWSDILMYKLEDIMLERFIPVTRIGDRAVFILERSLSVSTMAMPTVMAETVVCIDPRTHNYSQYHLNTGTWSLPVDLYGLDGYSLGPRSLIQHIIACCHRGTWYVGLFLTIFYCKNYFALYHLIYTS
jgi:hypothetical protein